MKAIHNDAYGKLIWDHLHGRPAVEIVERDDGYIACSSGPANYFAAFKQWPKHQRAAIGYVRGRVLDVGAGAGRCSLYLQRNGHPVVAIDVSPLAIRTCRKRGVRRTRVLPIQRVGPELGMFDTILMMGNNFGLFGSRRGAQRLLRRLHRITSPRALIIAETTDIYKTQDPDHLAYHRLNRRRGRMPGQIRLRVRYRTVATPWFDYLMVSRGELRKIVKGTGWKVKRFLASDGASYVAILDKYGQK